MGNWICTGQANIHKMECAAGMPSVHNCFSFLNKSCKQGAETIRKDFLLAHNLVPLQRLVIKFPSLRVSALKAWEKEGGRPISDYC